MCVEFPNADIRLKLWATWRRNGCSLKELGYPSSSSHTKPAGGGGFTEIPDNPEAEQIDKIIADLSKTYSDIHEVVMSKYYYYDSDRDGSKNCRIGMQKYQTYLKIGVSWIDRGLYDLQ